MKTTVADVMSARVVAALEDAEYKKIINVMRARRISALPVVDSHNRVLGVVSEADLLLKEAGRAPHHGSWLWLLPATRRKVTATVAKDLMTRPPVTIRPDATLAEAAARMCDHRVKRLPVTDKTGRLIGIISRTDVLSVFGRDDYDIRQEVVNGVIIGGFSLDPDAFEVTVRSGIVTITGQAENREAAAGLLEAVRHVEAVVGVRDRISYPREERTGTTRTPASSAFTARG